MARDITPRIVGFGELLWDILPAGPRLGGAPANFTIMCAHLANEAVLVSSLGDDDYGRNARSLLTQPHLDLRQLQVDPDHATGTVEVTFTEGNQPRYAIAREVAWDFVRTTPGLVGEARRASAVCYGTLGQRMEISRATLRSLLEAVRPDCARVCDINIRMPDCNPEILHWSMAHATVIKVSEEELPLAFSFLATLGLAVGSAPLTPRAAAQALLAFFPESKLVATTLGPGGCLVASRAGVHEHPGFPVTVVDTVGAGDAFTAGLVHAYLRGASLKQMAEAGNLCGSYVASQPEATPVLPSALLHRLNTL